MSGSEARLLGGGEKKKKKMLSSLMILHVKPGTSKGFKGKSLTIQIWASSFFFFKYLKRQDSPSLCVAYVSYFPSDGSPAFP